MSDISMKLSRLQRRAVAPVLAAIVALVGTAVPSMPARAQFAVACVNCSDWMTQLLGYVQQGMEYARQLEQLSTQIRQYQLQIDQYRNMVKNSQLLPQTYFDDALSTVRGIESALAQGRNVSYTWSDLDRRFRQRYPAFVDTYAAFDPNRMRSEAERFFDYANRSDEAFDLARTTLMAAKEQSRSMSEEQRAIEMIGSQLSNPQGQLDALQSVGELAQHSAQQMMKMRQIALVQVQIASTELANRQREKDIEVAAARALTDRKPSEPVATLNSSDDYYRARAPRR